MARRRKRREFDDLVLEFALMFAGLIAVLVFAVPGIRNRLITALFIIMAALVVLGIGAFCIAIFRNSRSPADRSIYSSFQSTEAQQQRWEAKVLAEAGMIPPARAFPKNPGAERTPNIPVAIIHQPKPSLEDHLERIDWFQFEKLIGIAYKKKGYHVVRRGGANADGGIDLLLSKDSASIAVQCKQWKKWDVGVAVIRELLGSMFIENIPKGILITSSSVTEQARNLARENNVQILEKRDVLHLLESVDAAYDPEIQWLLNDQRKYCPKCESEMVIRETRKGENAGRKFWGCSRYPACNCMMDYTQDGISSVRSISILYPSPTKVLGNSPFGINASIPPIGCYFRFSL